MSSETDFVILTQNLSNNNDSDDEIVIEDKPLVCPSKWETENTLETPQNAFLYAKKYDSKMQNLILQLEVLMDTENNKTVIRNL